MAKRREKVEFIAHKKVSKPVKVEFLTKEGEKIVFKAHTRVTKPVKIDFYADKKKK